MSYRHINAEDRTKIATLLDEGRDDSYIARRLGVHRSTIGREIARGSTKPKPKRKRPPKVPEILKIDGRKLRGTGFTKDKYQAQETHKKEVASAKRLNSFYSAKVAQKKAKDRRTNANRLRVRITPGSDSFLENYVLEKLVGNQWSPEQIAGRLYKDYAIPICPETIYSYIYNSGDKKQLVQHLRHHGNKYRRKRGTNARVKNSQSSLPSIHDRDEIIETRTRLGDLEGDTVVGLDKKDRLLTHVDRASGECYIRLVLNYDAKKIAQSTISITKSSLIGVHSITYDRGTEFAEYEAIGRATKASIHFADAYSSYQRGTNENLNGLVRQYYPKRYDFKNITIKELQDVQNKLNNRPRKRYNYRTPIEQRQYLLKTAFVALRD